MFDFYLFLALIAIGFIVGQTLERRHYRSIEQREADLLFVPTTNSKKPLGTLEGSIRSELVL